MSLPSSRDSKDQPSSQTRSRPSSQGTCKLTLNGKIQSIKQEVKEAIRNHKIFVIQGGFPSIRKALKRRGWLQKIPPRQKQRLGCSAEDEQIVFRMSEIKDGDFESLIWYLLQGMPADFIWSSKKTSVDWNCITKEQIVSRFPSVSFGTKIGLCNTLQQLYWYGDLPPANTFFPRCYNVFEKEELVAFINDYRLTACLGLLKWFLSKYGVKEKSKELFSVSIPEAPTATELNLEEKKFKIPQAAIYFALRRCVGHTRFQNHEDLDGWIGYHVADHKWDQFLTWYYLAVYSNADISDGNKLKSLCGAAKKALQTVAPLWPQMNMDGYHNLWIIKPGNKGRGQGIVIKSRMGNILSFVNPQKNQKPKPRYVVQKYIECPFLIHKTKFDIRQWFLVTDWQPLTIWMYRESYLRFSSQQFSLVDMHQSIHLCNNAVQKNYTNCNHRSDELPKNNMWDSHTFQAYLGVHGESLAWDTQIYPGMRQAIITTMLASENSVDTLGKNCFELFGADFMLTEDLNPWLIEINTGPCMAPSTSVTEKMCKQCLEDLIKVVIDRRDSSESDTGLFELIYQAPSLPVHTNEEVELCVSGERAVCHVQILDVQSSE